LDCLNTNLIKASYTKASIAYAMTNADIASASFSKIVWCYFNQTDFKAVIIITMRIKVRKNIIEVFNSKYNFRDNTLL
jgi:hypothetical protein